MDNLAYRGAPMGFVENVVVEEDWRGKRVGKRMMEFGMDRSRETGCYKVTLSSHLERETAHRLLEYQNRSPM
jgi:predicted N-acetyltransferase YhbS